MSERDSDTAQGFEPPIRSPFNEHLELQFVRLGDGVTEVRLPIRAELLNSAAMVHGGVYATLADTALAAAIYPQLPPGHMAVTLDLHCRYLRPARAGVLRAIARAVHVGRRTAAAEGEIWVDDVMLVKATGSFMIVSRAEMRGDASTPSSP